MLSEDLQRSTQPLVVLAGVSQSFDHRMVLSNLAIEFGPGVHAITGPNGCGKTTLLSVMAGVTAPDRGEIFVSGVDMRKDPKPAKAALGYLPDKPCIYPFLHGEEFLNLVGAIRGIQDMSLCRELLAAFALQPYLETRFSEMSLGTQRKFMLTGVFMQPLPVLLLDEPSNALNDSARKQLVETIQSRCTTACVVLADHDLSLLQEISAEYLRLANGQFTV